MLRTNTTTLEQNIKNGEYFLFPEFEIENNIFLGLSHESRELCNHGCYLQSLFFFNITVLSCT